MMSMGAENVFKWKQFQPDIILLTIRWIHQYRSEWDRSVRRHLKQMIHGELTKRI